MPELTNLQLAEREAKVRLEGWKEGWKERYERGWEEGWDEYMKRSKVRLAMDVAQARFGESLIDLESLLLAEKPEEVTDWTIRLANAPSIEEAMIGKGRLGNGAPL